MERERPGDQRDITGSSRRSTPKNNPSSPPRARRIAFRDCLPDVKRNADLDAKKILNEPVLCQVCSYKLPSPSLRCHRGRLPPTPSLSSSRALLLLGQREIFRPGSAGWRWTTTNRSNRWQHMSTLLPMYRSFTATDLTTRRFSPSSLQMG